MSRFIAIDLEGFPPPDIIETLSFETIRGELLADMAARMSVDGMDYDTQVLESDPSVKILEVAADREVILRARVNGAAKALLLSLAQRNDLANLGVLFGVQRATISPAGVDAFGSAVPVVMETDASLRNRIQLAPQAFSVAGPSGAYEWNVLLAAPTVTSVGIVAIPGTGRVNVYPLVAGGDGTPSTAVLNAIRTQLQADDVRPLTDQVSVIAPKIQRVTIDVTLLVKQGPDPAILVAAARVALQNYADARHSVGTPLYKSGIDAAAQGPGVEDVIINSPSTDVDPGANGATYVQKINVASRVVKV